MGVKDHLLHHRVGDHMGSLPRSPPPLPWELRARGLLSAQLGSRKKLPHTGPTQPGPRPSLRGWGTAKLSPFSPGLCPHRRVGALEGGVRAPPPPSARCKVPSHGGFGHQDSLAVGT